ncbi:CD48 antigen-like, partial [Poecilia reticulata]|uniref:CD48 antigen-like n=1 Tax=Poecilia reticulata TaxID=8081 RepID=UPI0007EAA67B
FTADLIYRKIGDSVALSPGQSFHISSVTWKRQTDLALQWFGGNITCYRYFKGRCDLDIGSGSLIINNLTLDDSGSYTFDINNSVLDKKDLRVIKPVPKPTVSVDCNNEKTDCNLTCEANITSEFGPVTYTWETGDTELSNDKELSLTTDNKESSFSCMLRNPISTNSSEEESNLVRRENFKYTADCKAPDYSTDSGWDWPLCCMQTNTCHILTHLLKSWIQSSSHFLRRQWRTMKTMKMKRTSWSVVTKTFPGLHAVI